MTFRIGGIYRMVVCDLNFRLVGMIVACNTVQLSLSGADSDIRWGKVVWVPDGHGSSWQVGDDKLLTLAPMVEAWEEITAEEAIMYRMVS